MFGSVILDVAIGLILVYLLLSLIASGIHEAIASLLKTRSKLLEKGITELLRDRTLIAAFYDHPQISALYLEPYTTAQQRRTLPSYIPSRSFALALLDIAARGRDLTSKLEAGPGATVLSVENLRPLVPNVGNEAVQRVLLSAIDAAAGDLAKVQASIEAWFDSSMERVSGWYKRKTQLTLTAIGLVLAVGADVDSIGIANRLYRSPVARQAALAMAADVAKEPTTPATQDPKQAAERLDSLNILVPWADVHVAGTFPTRAEWKSIGQHVWSSLIGWLITAFAVALGAPFWFDALSRLVAIRSSNKPQPKGASTSGAAEPGAAQPTTATSSVASVPAPTSVAPSFQPHEWSSGDPHRGDI